MIATLLRIGFHVTVVPAGQGERKWIQMFFSCVCVCVVADLEGFFSPFFVVFE